jgi:hypothetical protein
MPGNQAACSAGGRLSTCVRFVSVRSQNRFLVSTLSPKSKKKAEEPVEEKGSEKKKKKKKRTGG